MPSRISARRWSLCRPSSHSGWTTSSRLQALRSSVSEPVPPSAVRQHRVDGRLRVGQVDAELGVRAAGHAVVAVHRHEPPDVEAVGGAEVAAPHPRGPVVARGEPAPELLVGSRRSVVAAVEHGAGAERVDPRSRGPGEQPPVEPIEPARAGRRSTTRSRGSGAPAPTRAPRGRSRTRGCRTSPTRGRSASAAPRPVPRSGRRTAR